ncbi:MAG: transcriptional regulator [Gemmatimonadetes bacterium]|nr:transcriptional regulator [Gemmatimonadota bacterium]|tara:strand:- start:2684 stop:3067 length:384 start_codon:yes stop_codon:yes gene_type:complete
MEQEDCEYFKKILVDKRNEIRNDLGVLESHSMNNTSADSSGDLIYSDHMSDLGSASMEREKAFLFASRDGAYLEQLEGAIQRIEEGTYGVCRVCQTEISKARLEAVPTTKICVACKEAEAAEKEKRA